jgi:hypothetical protein
MKNKKLVLVGYPAVYFLHFARAMERNGFEIFWICALRADARYLRAQGVNLAQVLDLTCGFDPRQQTDYQIGQQLAAWESDCLPRVNDIILMDRLLRHKSPEFARRYLAHVTSRVADFIQSRSICLASSWRDTAPQLATMLVCRKLGVPCVVPTRTRIPQEMYGFSMGHQTRDMLQLRPITQTERQWAETFLQAFETRGVKPALKRAAKHLSDVLRMLPTHVSALLYEIRRMPADRGNDYTRYTIPKLMAMYLVRKYNLLRYKLQSPCLKDGLRSEPFCLYALHTQPESSIDVQASFFSDQIALIRQIVRALPASHILYVKVHPTDVDGKSIAFYRELSRLPGVRLLDFSVDPRSLFERTTLFFALTGTIAYEAALLGKPVIALADNFFNRLPSVHTCLTPTALPNLVRQILTEPQDPASLRPQILEFLAWVRACSYDGEVSRFHLGHHVRLTQQDLETVYRAYNDLINHFAPRTGEVGDAMQEN